MISFIFFLVPIVPISSTIHNIILSSTKTGQEISHHHRSSSSSPREEKARCSSLISSGENKTKNWRRTKSPSPQCRLRHKKLRLIIIAIMGAAASTTPRAPPASSPPSCFARAASAVCGPLLSSSPCPTAANTAFNTARLKKIPMSYLSKTSQPSFLRNGKVGTKRGLDGHDQPNFGCDEEVLDVNVRDLRTLSSCERTPELGKEGFVLRRFHEEVDKFSAEFERERRERAAAGHQNANGVHRVVAEPGATAKKVRRVSSRKLTEDQIPDIEAERGMTPLQILAVAKAYVALDDPPSPVVEEEDAGPPGQHDPRINLSFADINPSIFRSLKPSYSAKAMELSYSEKPIDFKDADEVILRYYPQVIQFIKQVTGASEVFPFDHNLRFADFATTDKEIANSKVQVQKPIGNVHTDYTIHSAPRRLLDLIRPPTTNDVWGKYLQEGRSLVPEELVLGGPSARKGGEEKGRGAGVRRGSEEELSHAPVVGAGPGGNWNFVASPRDESGRGAGEDGPGRRGSVDDKVGAANTRKVGATSTAIFFNGFLQQRGAIPVYFIFSRMAGLWLFAMTMRTTFFFCNQSFPNLRHN